MDNGSFTIQYDNIVLEKNDPEFDWNCRTISTLFVLIAFGLLLEFVGNGFLYGIFIYEKYGIDSMRRTIINMLLSQICFAYIFLNIFAMPFWIYGNFVSSDGIEYHFTIWTGLVMTSVFYFTCFCMCQIMILKCLYLTKWPTMALLDDYFAATFLGLSSILMAIELSVIRIGMGEFSSNIHVKMLTGNHLVERSHLHQNVFFWCKVVQVGSTVVILVVYVIFFFLKEWKKKKYVYPAQVHSKDSKRVSTISITSQKIRNVQSNVNIGRDGKNINLVGNLGTALIVCLLCGFLMVNLFYVSGFEIGTFAEKINALLPFLVPSFILPGLFYLNKPKSIQIIKDVLL